jgi:hypothetical protein
MAEHAGPLPEGERQPERESPDLRLLIGAYARDLYGIQTALKHGADINAVHAQTGLSALHIAIGANDLPLCRYLIERCGAAFFADKFGRWPTLVAIECHADDELSDYIVEQEARYLERNP